MTPLKDEELRRIEAARCGECGSWDASCASEVPVKDCGCARCLRAENETLLRERDAECQRADAEFARADDAECRLADAERERDEARAERDAFGYDSLSRARLAAEAHNAALREALVEALAQLNYVRAAGKVDWESIERAQDKARAALALPPGDALRALAVRLCEAQREACSRASKESYYAAKSVHAQSVETVPLVVDDVLGKAGK